jgi:hypothetical protein
LLPALDPPCRGHWQRDCVYYPEVIVIVPGIPKSGTRVKLERLTYFPESHEKFH